MDKNEYEVNPENFQVKRIQLKFHSSLIRFIYIYLQK